MGANPTAQSIRFVVEAAHLKSRQRFIVVVQSRAETSVWTCFGDRKAPPLSLAAFSLFLFLKRFMRRRMQMLASGHHTVPRQYRSAETAARTRLGHNRCCHVVLLGSWRRVPGYG